MPNVVGSAYDVAKARLDAQPLTPVVVYKPASAGQALHVVVKQIPARGRLSSYNHVTIVFAKPLHGVVPKVVGMKLPEARRAARATEAEDHRSRDRVEDRAPAAESRGGRRPGTAGHALGKARLTNREPAMA